MKILIADEMHPSIINMLASEGWEYAYLPKLKREEILNQMAGFEGLFIRSKTYIDREFLDHSPQLRFIARAGAGLDLIDIEEVNSRNIQLFHAGEGNRDAVAEHAVGLLLALFNNIVRSDKEVRKGIWEREGNRGIELMNKTVGLIGYGNNGSATARRLKSFDCRILAYDKYKKNYSDAYVDEATLEQIMLESDILSLHIPLTTETKGWVDGLFIERMARPFFLMNVARGEIVSLEGLVHALKSGKILGACLDVLENEKLSSLTPSQQESFEFLRASDKVILTPHVAGWSQESYVRINEVLKRQIKAWLDSQK